LALHSSAVVLIPKFQSTGTQLISQLSKDREGLKSLTCFQRTPQYCVPARDGPVTQKDVDAINAKYDEMWDLANKCAFGLDFAMPTKSIFEVTEEERRKEFEYAWKRGSGFYFLLGTFKYAPFPVQSSLLRVLLAVTAT
jgi:cyclohexanone monooxygenase